VERELAEIRESGVSVVRWFLFGDGRSGFLSAKGIPRELDLFKARRDEDRVSLFLPGRRAR